MIDANFLDSSPKVNDLSCDPATVRFRKSLQLFVRFMECSS